MEAKVQQLLDKFGCRLEDFWLEYRLNKWVGSYYVGRMVVRRDGYDGSATESGEDLSDIDALVERLASLAVLDLTSKEREAEAELREKSKKGGDSAG